VFQYFVIQDGITDVGNVDILVRRFLVSMSAKDKIVVTHSRLDALNIHRRSPLSSSTPRDHPTEV